MWIELIKLTALLLAFTMLLTFVFRAAGRDSIQSQILQGVLFGLIAVIGMSMPVNFAPGFIFDPRSVLVSMAGFFGGPVTAIPAAVIAGGYRLWLGGAGAVAGMLVVVLSCLAGIGAFYLRKYRLYSINAVNLFLFGFLSHFIALFGLFILPNDIMWKVIQNLSIPFFLIYPPMTVFLGFLIDFISKKFDVERQLVSSTAQLRALFDESPDLMWFKDKHGTYLMCNQQFEKFFGAAEIDIKGKTDYDFVDEQLADLFRKMDKEAMTTGQPTINEETVTYSEDGRSVLLETIKTPIYDENHELLGVLGVSHDITLRAETEERLRQSAIVFESTSEGVVITDKDANILDVNKSFTEITGYTREEVIGRNTRILSSGRHPKEFYDTMWSALSRTGIWRGEIWNQRKDKSIYPEWLTISEVKGSDNCITHYVAVFSDITSIKQSQDKLDFLAHHDPLTGLANRLLFSERLEASLSRAKRHNSKLAILFIDIDRFKNINDSFGHKAGDDLLKHISKGLRTVIRVEDLIARISGDEFVILLEDIDDTNFIIGAIEKVTSVISSTFLIEEHRIQVTASVGISLFPMDGDNVIDLIRNADAAMYRAKDEGRNTYQFYTRDLTEKAFERVVMENELREALVNKEFALHYQPQISLTSKRIIGLEALIRWNHPELGLIPPDQFIPLTEDSGLINPIGEWVIYEACRQGKEWLEAGFDYGRIAVNISSVQINKGNLKSIVSAALSKTKLPPSCIELEVTEGAIMKRTDSAIKQMTELRNLGITLSVDDFGTGYSSLSYLKKLPISKLKIDQSFVRDIPSDEDDNAIVNAVISMGINLGLTVIAEGVENSSQELFLIDAGCHEAQGYLYNRPLGVGEIEALFHNSTPSK